MIKNLTFFTLLGVFLISCSNFNTLKIKKTNFEDEVSRAQNLVFTFNKPLISDSALINKWDTTKYIKFEPHIPGKFMWTGKSELTFSPLGALLPATSYKGILKKDLTRYSNTKFDIDDEPVLFHTPFLNISSISTFWALSDEITPGIEVRCQVAFNNPVSPVKLKALLKMEVDGKEMLYRIITQNDADIIEVAFPFDGQADDKAVKGEVTISKGLACTGGNTETTDALKEAFVIPSKDKLSISDIESGFDNGKGYINVLTSQPVVAEGLAAFIKIDPALNIETELLSNGFQIKGEFLGSQSYTLLIKKGVKSLFNRELENDFSRVVSFADPIPDISFTEHKAVYLSTKGERNLGVNIINVPKVRVSVFKVFENNIQHYMRQGKNWDYHYDEVIR